ncbi:MAG: SDR family oxidoreductase [Proteobacteria bacterium]|nr:SDR family oxidoreductase [Pseudomonadota bacterium]
MRRIVITGATGTLGSALARVYDERGVEVIGVSRRPHGKLEHCAETRTNAQVSQADAAALLADDPDCIVLCAGQIEDDVGPGGLPRAEALLALHQINAVFPSLVALAASHRDWSRSLDVVAVGSIADGAPSSFGPVYHSSKIALHYFYTAVAPIARGHNPRVRLRLYRPGVIRGPLSWAPVLRLNESGRKIRARRCEGAPEADTVARHLAQWIDGDQTIGTYSEPVSFRLLRLLFALAPGPYHRLQQWAWQRGSRFS